MTRADIAVERIRLEHKIAAGKQAADDLRKLQDACDHPEILTWVQGGWVTTTCYICHHKDVREETREEAPMG